MSKQDKKTGKALERLIASLEKALADKPDILVEAPKRLIDRTTGKLREHDVVLTIKQGHHSILVAIECRDNSRPVTVNQVEGFCAKCQDTGIGRGAIVSASGFYKNARNKANYLGIRCLDLERVGSFDWLLAPGIHAITRRIIRDEWTFFPSEDGIVEANNFEIIDKNGNVATRAALRENSKRALSKLLPENPDAVDEGELPVRFPGSGLLLRNQSTGATVPVDYAIVRIRYSITKELVPLQLVQYKDNEDTITDAAYADLKMGDRSARLLVVYKEDEGGKIIILPQVKKD